MNQRLIQVGAGVLLVGGIAAGALLLAPNEWHATWEATVKAPAPVITSIVQTRGGWARLEKMIHKDDRGFSAESGGDPDRGKGMVVAWTGADGHRTLTLTDVTPERVAYTLVVDAPKATIQGELRLRADGDGTTITWSESGPLPGGALDAIFNRPDAAAINAAHAKKAEALRAIVEADAVEAAVLQKMTDPGP